jgi:hypothetical protein
VPYCCGIEEEAAVGETLRGDDPIRSCLIWNAGHISVGLANWFDGLVCIAVTERKSAF